jgi:hypothetical protein
MDIQHGQSGGKIYTYHFNHGRGEPELRFKTGWAGPTDENPEGGQGEGKILNMLFECILNRTPYATAITYFTFHREGMLNNLDNFYLNPYDNGPRISILTEGGVTAFRRLRYNMPDHPGLITILRQLRIGPDAGAGAAMDVVGFNFNRYWLALVNSLKSRIRRDAVVIRPSMSHMVYTNALAISASSVYDEFNLGVVGGVSGIDEACPLFSKFFARVRKIYDPGSPRDQVSKSSGSLLKKSEFPPLSEASSQDSTSYDDDDDDDDDDDQLMDTHLQIGRLVQEYMPTSLGPITRGKSKGSSRCSVGASARGNRASSETQASSGNRGRGRKK